MTKLGRNDPCSCGSGKKYKHCCLPKQTAVVGSAQQALRQGAALHAAGRLQEASSSYREALRLRPGDAEIHTRLGTALQQQGELTLAIASYREALRLVPSLVPARFNFGTALQSLGDLDGAAAEYRQALQLKPDYPEAHNNLGNVLHSQGELAGAIAEYREALRLRPDYLLARSNLGTALRGHGELAEAIVQYQEALRVHPESLQARNNLGMALVEQGDLTNGAIQFQKALQLESTCQEAHVNLAKAQHALGILPEAIAHYRAALQGAPDDAELHNDLGAALRDLGRPTDAIEQYREALRVKPAYPEAHHSLAIALQDAGDDSGAVEQYREAIRLRPDYALALGNLVYRLEHLCEWADIDLLWEQTRNLLRFDPSSSIPPFTAVSMPSGPAEQLQWAQNWAAARLGHMARLRDELGFTFGSGPRHRLRIGYLSTDYHEHAVAYLVAELFELHDRNRFEVIAYSIGRDDTSPVRQRLVAGCDRFEDLRALSAVAAAEQIYHDGIDILIDLNGYTHGCRTEILALKPAPVQVNYLGYPGTMGAHFIDYIVTDRFVTPPEQQVFFSERFEYLPNTYLVNDRKRPIAERSPTRTECGLPQAGFVFCCFNSNYKLNAQIFDIWMRLLQAISGSVLWLRESHVWAATNLRREAENRGVDPDRLVFAEKRELPEHLARHRLADLFLDTLPYNAHATASDAFWAGLPVLTCAGETFAGRVAGSLLQAIGLQELITTSLEEYEAKALWLAQHPEEIHALKAKLAANRDTMPLFDTERYTRNLEAAYERMWQTFVASSEIEARLTV
jgi:protein O-GlcNAc transferase